MKKNDIIIICASLVGAGLLIWLIILITGHHKTYDWSESYLENSNQPYGTDIVSELLEDYFSWKDYNVVKNDLNERLLKADEHTNYIFIGNEPFYTDSTFNLLRDFVHRGNDAFLAVNEIPELISAEILSGNHYNAKKDTLFYIDAFGDSSYLLQDSYQTDTADLSYFLMPHMQMNFNDPAFHRDSSWSFLSMERGEEMPRAWEYFMPAFTNKIQCKEIGTIQSSHFINFIGVPYGKGNFYIHVDPVVFTNYFEIRKENLEFTSKVFSYLKPGDILWDEYSKSYNDSPQEIQSEGPLKFILSQRSLRWAWYTLLAGVLLYVAFRAKRVQQAIPVMEPNENRSLEFVQTIGRMYYMRKNHKQLAQQKMRLFLNYINVHFRLNTQNVNDEFMQKLQQKSEVPKEDIAAIFDQYSKMENARNIKDGDIIRFHELLDNFYKHCK